MVATLSTIPLPRQSLDPGGRTRHWYENELGWRTAPGTPVRLVVGHRFDVLDVPLEAGRAALRHLGQGSPVAVQGDRMRLLVAAGSAEELPGLLRWLEWEALDLDLVALGPGTLMDARRPPPGRPERGPCQASGRPEPGRSPAVGAVHRGPPCGCGPPSLGARSRPRCRRCRPWGAVEAPPISYGWWTPRRRSATGSGCGAGTPSRLRSPSSPLQTL
jgi:hypothetical protein